MPRNGSGVYSKASASFVPSTTIASASVNADLDDIVSDLNTARPITAGGTGAASQIGGWDGLTAKGTDVPSGSTINLTTATGPRIDITGTTSITAVTLAAGSLRIARATGIFVLTASATLLVNGSSSVNYTTKVGDLLIFEADSTVVSVWAISGGAAAFTGGTLTSALNFAPTVTIASASTVAIGAAASNELIVSGTTTITAFDTVAAGVTREVLFSGALTLTHNGTSLILPGLANIQTAANDTACFRSLGSGNWVCLWYRKAVQPVASGQTLISFRPSQNEPPASNYATFSTLNGHPILQFPDGVVDVAIFTGILPANYGGNGLTVEIEWENSTTSTLKVCFGAYIEYMDVGTTNFSSDSFSSEVIDTTGVAANATVGVSSKSSLAFTSGAAMDNLVAGGTFRLKIARETGQANDTNAGTVGVLAVRVKET